MHRSHVPSVEAAVSAVWPSGECVDGVHTLATVDAEEWELASQVRGHHLLIRVDLLYRTSAEIEKGTILSSPGDSDTATEYYSRVWHSTIDCR